MIISSALAMIAVTFVMAGGFYSLVLVLQFLYCVVMTIVIYMEGLPARLKEKLCLNKMKNSPGETKI